MKKKAKEELDIRKYIVKGAVRSAFRCAEIVLLAGAALIGININS